MSDDKLPMRSGAWDWSKGGPVQEPDGSEPIPEKFEQAIVKCRVEAECIQKLRAVASKLDDPVDVAAICSAAIRLHETTEALRAIGIERSKLWTDFPVAGHMAQLQPLMRAITEGCVQVLVMDGKVETSEDE